jgi:hypothetical protein
MIVDVNFSLQLFSQVEQGGPAFLSIVTFVESSDFFLVGSSSSSVLGEGFCECISVRTIIMEIEHRQILEYFTLFLSDTLNAL